MPTAEIVPITTILPPTAEHALIKEARQQITPQHFTEQYSFFKKLTEEEQETLLDESRQLQNAMLLSGISDLEKGLHLLEIHNLLAPKGHFSKFLRRFTRLSNKQAHRLMNGYKNANRFFSPAVLKQAMRRDMKIFCDDPAKPLGVYTVAVRQIEGPRKGKKHKRVGPGPNASPEAVTKWLDKVEQFTKERRSRIIKAKKAGKYLVEDIASDPESTKIQVYRFARARIRKLPTAVTRMQWLADVMGPLMAECGFQSGQMFEPSAVPEEWRPKPVGRPQLAAAAGDE